MIAICSNFTQALLSELKKITRLLYGTELVELYDGRFENEPESANVGKLMFFVDTTTIELIQPNLNSDELDIPELEVYINLIVANRTLVNPSQKEPHLADILLNVLYALKRVKFFDTRLKRVGRIDTLVKADSYAVMRLGDLVFNLNNRMA